jgi:hypothetical protein
MDYTSRNARIHIYLDQVGVKKDRNGSQPIGKAQLDSNATSSCPLKRTRSIYMIK